MSPSFVNAADGQKLCYLALKKQLTQSRTAAASVSLVGGGTEGNARSVCGLP